MEDPTLPDPTLPGDVCSLGFAALARSGVAPFDELLLALGAEFRPVDRRRARERLDELGRGLFGLPELDPGAQACRLAEVLGRDAGLRPTACGQAALFLDEVLRTGRGHPALLAVTYVEAARRAGLRLMLFSSPRSWYAGVPGEAALMVVDPAAAGQPGLPPSPPPAQLRRHCAHEVAFGILGGLAFHYSRLGHKDEASRARGLRAQLPVEDDSPAEDG